MASKGPRLKLDHDSKARRQKAPEAFKEPRRSKTHWDHVLEEMVWLSKDFESERKWKLAQARKVALKASKGMLDQATRGEKKLKEEEQRMRKVALNISKDMKKFWIKIEKLVLYKHQMELDEKKKKALDKQLEFLLGQTERYSTMLAENLVSKPSQPCSSLGIPNNEGAQNDKCKPAKLTDVPQEDFASDDVDFELQSEDESEDDERTIAEDEALITEQENQEELAALKNESELPLEELVKHYASGKVSGENSPSMGENITNYTSDGEHEDNSSSEHEDAGNSASDGELDANSTPEGGEPYGSEDNVADGSAAIQIDGSGNSVIRDSHSVENDVAVCASENQLLGSRECLMTNIPTGLLEPAKATESYDFDEEPEDGDFAFLAGEEKDDETTLLEEEELEKAESNNTADEIAMLQKESEIPLEELLARYNKSSKDDELSLDGSEEYDSAHSDSAFSDNQLGALDNGEDDLKQLDVSTDEAVESVHVAPLIIEDDPENVKISGGNESENRIADAAAAARSAQPTGNTFSTTKVLTKFPFLLKYPLREYQHIGLDWLVTMYEKRLNGILADEMGLGKTIMTIALLAHLACEKGIWGPHLIVVPTSVMLNWETEFLKWCPAFKILTYFGSAKERKFKRQGWLKPNSFHVCITTYRLVIQDSKVFKRKKWKYLILDEAHLIKNWKSQRWQTLLNFNSKRRVLLTGTPLQNDLMELWSLMHFLMPHIFQSHQEFKDWFSNPISGMVEGQERVNKEVVDRLHNVLRPFILRRLKRDVEKQLPMKHEHVIYCKLSRRQRNLYEDFIASSDTQATLASANFFGMISVIMQLRKVCNHPDLFEGRPIISSFDMDGLDIQLSSSVCSTLSSDLLTDVNLCSLGLVFTDLDFNMTSWEYDEVKAISTPSKLIEEVPILDSVKETGPGSKLQEKFSCSNIFEDVRRALLDEKIREIKERAASVTWWNSLRCEKKPIYSTTMRELVTVRHPVYDIHHQEVYPPFLCFSKLRDVILSPVERFQRMIDLVESFMFAIPAARAPVPACWCSKTGAPVFLNPSYKNRCSETLLPLLTPIRPSIVRRQLYFPDRRLIQFDCGKLQQLAVLLRKLKSAGHRALIFTQMTKMLDILEAFINLYGYTYMRLDGSTQPEERQTLMQRFNTNPKIFLFILSTRSGGVGINLVGADTVIFYDSDWNPAMDQQAQDRCHRIGQTREVHIYRLISESTIEENILKKANQKRALDDLVIQSGGYNTEFFKKLDPIEFFSGHKSLYTKTLEKEKGCDYGAEASVSNADVEAALKFAEDEADYMALKKVELEEAVDNQEFTEDAILRTEDDDFVNDDDAKADDPADQEVTTNNKEQGLSLLVNNTFEEKGPVFAGEEDNTDMLADLKQMAAAAAAAGQSMTSFENQLRPIDRYAIRFLELWDPIIDTAAESQVSFEETAWELERIEKYKEEMEAEIDDDEEPLVYERWDSDFATEAYRQQVETLAQHQLMEELEAKAKQKEDADDGHTWALMNEAPGNAKSKPRKKTKKAKFKSLKKRSLTLDSKRMKEEQPVEAMSTDEDEGHLELRLIPQSSVVQKKRKGAELTIDIEEQKSAKNKFKKSKKTHFEFSSSDLDSNLSCMLVDDSLESKLSQKMVVNGDHKAASRNRMGGKLSISAMPVKRVFMIKPEKSNKGNVWSKNFVPTPDSWLPQEDAILCAVVHEYGPHWSLASETLYGMSAGGFYRGRYRHPAHCCERFRELFQRCVLSSPLNLSNEKMNHTGSGKALLKVTQENMQALLNIAAEQPDHELLLQRHFTAVLSSVWKASHFGSHKKFSPLLSSFDVGSRCFSTVHQVSENSVGNPAKRAKLTTSGYSSKLLAAALNDANTNTGQPDERAVLSNQKDEAPFNVEELELTLEFQKEDVDSLIPLPSVINLSIPCSDISTPMNKDFGEHYLKASTKSAENRLRDAARVYFEGEGGLCWVPHAFAGNDVKSQPQKALKSQFLGKHKLPLSDSIKPPRSKLKRASLEHDDMHHAFSFPPWEPLTFDSNLSFHLTSSVNTTDNWMEDIPHHASPVDEGIPLEMGSSETVLHDYIAGFISDLDDLSVLPDCTDIG